ncbi:MAG: C10 family peptidase [Bacteroidetes bacterium]|nr:C10 family peptidase [Bacteroidota bacterium]
MKKAHLLAGVLACSLTSSYARVVSPEKAQQAAQTYYQVNGYPNKNMHLVYTEKSLDGTPVYYTFNTENNKGFIIISADDAAHPIIGYSTQNGFVVPEVHSNAAHWLQKRKKEIETIRQNNLLADETITNEWKGIYVSKQNNQRLQQANQSNSLSYSVTPLVQSTWNQNGGGSVPYNNLCPGGSVTGCVATAMAQIMRYWSYPTQGIGSSSYCDCTTSSLGGTPFTNNYGTLSANYGATTYNWSNMPLNSSTSDVATLMYQCGVSVEMDYAPSGSGAWVISADDSICAQRSYVKYFGYDPYTIQGLIKSNYSDPAWVQLLQNDLLNGRPIQYVGNDPSEGGHTWVCDGFDNNDNFHMNWGWGGADDGFFYINNLNSGNGNFSTGCEALIGIEPMPQSALDAGVPAFANPLNGIACSTHFSPQITLQNYGTSTLTTCTLNYSLDGGTVATQAWSGSLTTGQTATVSLPSISITAGTHTLVCYSSNPNGGTDGNTINNQSISIFSYGITAAFAANQTSACYVPFPVNCVNNTTNATNYNWSFGDGTGSTAFSPAHTYSASGTYQIKLISSACSGAVSDSAMATITINTPSLPTAIGATVCASASATLTASGSGTMVWYNAAGTQVGMGPNYITPTLTANSTYYVSNTNTVAAVYGAPATNASLGGGGYINASHALIFDVSTAFILQTVDVYASSSGGAPTIQLLDNTGNIVNTLTPTLSLAGKNTLSLNWSINPGSGYQLVENGTTVNLYRNSIGAPIAYPINVGSVASITGNDVSDNTRYYYFYNWQVQAQACASQSIPVTATVQACSSGIENFSNNKTFQLYPNPASQSITIAANASLNVVSVYNSLGELIYQQKINDTTAAIDVSMLPSGIYIIQAQGICSRFIKQ